MKRTIKLQREYPFPPERIWNALTDKKALGEWLMPAEAFEPVVGREFQFRTKPQPGFDGIVNCKVLTVVPLQELAYSWSGTDGMATKVTYRLEKTASGTRLHLEHGEFIGLKETMISFILGRGWASMMKTRFPAAVERLGGASKSAVECETPDVADRVLAGVANKLPSK